jgi:hypothetical protein
MTADWQKIAKLAGMLGSAGDGEVVNAARMVEKALKNQGLSWGDFANRISGGASYNPTTAARTAAEQAQARRREENDQWEKRMHEEEEKTRQDRARTRKW